MQIQSFTIPDPRVAVANLHREFGELAVAARSWDHALEAANGTYPSHEFVAKFRAFGTRLEAAGAAATRTGAFSTELADMGRSRLRVPFLTHSRLEHMARERLTFQPGGSIGAPAWSSLLDQVVLDLERGERLLYGRLVTMEPIRPKVPNHGPGGSQPYPGSGPRPTPIP